MKDSPHFSVPEKKHNDFLSKPVLLGGGAVIALVFIQILLLRAVGDLFTSVLIFGIGWFVGMRVNK